MRERHVGISLGLIDSLSDGLGEFSTQIGERIAAAAPHWRAAYGVRFHFHLHERWHGHFGPEVGYLAARRSQGYWHWQRGPRFDLWHALNQLGRIAPPLGTKRALLTIHDLNMLYGEDPAAAQRDLRKLATRLRRFDHVSTLTHHVEGDIRRHLGWVGPVAVIPNGARDLTRHPREPVPGLEPGAYFFHLSRMSASKNPGALIEMARRWPERMLVLAGPHSRESDALRAQAERGDPPNLRVLQDISNAQKSWLYANCAAFLFPSLTEGFGLPPLEAMHFGKPVFLSRLTSLPEVGGDAAAYFDGFEPLAMRRCIEAALPALAMRTDAIRAHAAGYTWDRAGDAYLALYRDLLGLA